MSQHRHETLPVLISVLALTLALPVAAELSVDAITILSQAPSAIAGSAETDDFFGEVLAQGDFDDDGYDDLVVGIPHEDVGPLVDAGAVFVIYGSSTGFSSSLNELFTADSTGIPGIAEAGDQLGRALSVGDFNGDGYDDLAAGIPAEDVAGKVDAGAVLVLMGSSGGLQSVDAQVWTEDLLTAEDNVWAFSRMGQALAAGDYNCDGRDDLAVGLPGDTTSDQAGSGSVVVLYGSVAGLTSSGHSTFNTTELGFALANTAFGAALAAGEFLVDTGAPAPCDDLLIAIPGIDYGSEAGTALVLEGNSTGVDLNLSNIRTVGPIVGDPSEDSWASAVGDTAGDGELDSVALGIVSHDDPLPNSGLVTFLTYGSRTELSLDEVAPPEAAAALGGGLAIADFNLDGIDDLLVGAPGLGAADEPTGSGSVFYLPGRAGIGPDVPGLRSWRLQDLGYEPSASSDRLGAALVAADFNGDSLMDAAFGIPGRDLGDQSQAGVVAVLTGAPLTEMIFSDGFEAGNTTAW